MSHIVIGTAGHIDHGKTALVKALTGMDTDTLREERERQITIDLGVAFLGDGVTVIDVPGHERFIKNMITGVATLDHVLLVVAADDGIMPQTREHTDILQLLGIRSGTIVVTKTSMVDSDWLELVCEELREFVRGTFLEHAPLHRVDSLSGAGIEELRSGLQAQLAELPPVQESGIFRLAVDRAFSVKGHGTVVTGTVLSGRLKTGDELELLPSLRRTKARGLQTHGQPVASVSQNDRAAINLQAVALDDVQRGDILATPGILKPGTLLDVSLTLLPGSPPLANRDRVRVHI
ncbi:MAG: selenocysteine-specific translation elongation factor, partial [Candidatus Cloacimonetes bacterium]|nr:selenocysteine-specific translation elongation factor [Candidatus Cloacimonadota bacterium]